jgi:hypothetical protein
MWLASTRFVDDAYAVQVGQRGGDGCAMPATRCGACPPADRLARVAGAQLARRRVGDTDHGHNPGMCGPLQPLDLEAQPVDSGRRCRLDHDGTVVVHVQPDVHVHATTIDESA